MNSECLTTENNFDWTGKIQSSPWASAENFPGGESRNVASAWPFRLVDDPTKMDVHKALHPFYTTKKTPKITATVANRVFSLQTFLH